MCLAPGRKIQGRNTDLQKKKIIYIYFLLFIHQKFIEDLVGPRDMLDKVTVSLHREP